VKGGGGRRDALSTPTARPVHASFLVFRTVMTVIIGFDEILSFWCTALGDWRTALGDWFLGMLESGHCQRRINIANREYSSWGEYTSSWADSKFSWTIYYIKIISPRRFHLYLLSMSSFNFSAAVRASGHMIRLDQVCTSTCGCS